MTNMSNKGKADWLAAAATVLSLVTCYGTLAAVGLLGTLGFTIALNETVWAGAIVVFAWLALLALWIGRRRHGAFWPIASAGIGAVLITFTMLVAYIRVVELIGFAFLCAGTFLGWRSQRAGRRRLNAE